MPEPVGTSPWNINFSNSFSEFINSPMGWTGSLSILVIALSAFACAFLLLVAASRFQKRIQKPWAFFIFAMAFVSIGLLQVWDLVAKFLPISENRSETEILAGITSLISVALLWPMLRESFAVSEESLLDHKDQQIEIANDKYNLLLAGSDVGVFEWNDFKNFARSIFWSERMFELLGFKPNSFEPSVEFFLSLIHPEDRVSAQRLLCQSPMPEPVDYRIRVFDEYRWFRVRNIVKLDAKGKALFAIGSIENIHQQKMTEEKILTMNEVLEEEIQKRTRQLESASRAKTRFLANMSHELRTPLGLVLGFSELLHDNKNLDPEAREAIDLIIKNGEILTRVINDLLDLSKIEAGKIRFQFSKVTIKQLMDDFQDAFSEEADAKNLEFSFHNHCGEDEVIVTDDIRFKQIVYNLLANALKFTEKGSVRVSIGKTEEKKYFLDVVDTGIGIPDFEKECIFEEFARSEIMDAAPKVGTGLGLKLAQNLAQALGGDVELVSSQVGKGSHFRFTFLNDERRLQKQTERRKELSLSSKLNDFEVFVLDDNEDNIRLAEIFLKKLGCRVRGFSSAKSLFAEMVSAEPDLILLDINMPEMNGFEVFDRLRQSGYKNPIWALTAYSLNEDIQAILDHGFDDYIRKPMSADSMKRKLTFELRERSND